MVNPAPGRVVVIGAGLGGLRSAEALRRRGYAGRLVMLGAERHLPYDRPPLSKQVLRGEASLPLLRAASDLDSLDATVLLDTPAIGLSVDDHLVHTATGDVAYDVAIIATGAVPRRVPGVEGGRVLRTFDDAHALRADLKQESRLLIIGAGLIGCEVAASARALGVTVAMVDVLPAPAIRVLGPDVGRLVADMHTEHGVELLLNRTVVDATRHEDGHRVALDDGTEVDADVVLESIGVIPDTSWLGSSSGIRRDNGVVCDADGRAAPDVFAVGDVANWAGHRHEHWTNVGLQADHVAAAILGQDIPPGNVSYWWSDQYEVKLQGLGQPLPEHDVAIVTWGPKARPVAVYSHHGRLTGLVGFSAAGAIMRLRGDVAAGTEVGEILDRLSPGTPAG